MAEWSIREQEAYGVGEHLASEGMRCPVDPGHGGLYPGKSWMGIVTERYWGQERANTKGIQPMQAGSQRMGPLP